MDIFQELYNSAKTVGDQKSTQTDDDYFRKIVQTVARIPNSEWIKLSPQTQTWYNSAATALKAGKPIPPCPGFTSRYILPVPVPGEWKASAPTTSPPIPITPIKKKKDTGVMDAIRKTIIFYPHWTTRKVFNYLKNNGWPDVSMDTVTVEASNIRHTIELARQLGFWNDKKYDTIQEPATTNTTAVSN